MLRASSEGPAQEMPICPSCRKAQVAQEPGHQQCRRGWSGKQGTGPQAAKTAFRPWLPPQLVSR